MNIQRVGVLGSGIMGSGIAEVVAAAGVTVIVRSRSRATADAMLTALERSLAKQVEREKRTQSDADALRARVTATTSLVDVATCDLIIESVVENLDVKLALFNELNDVISDHTILATNTSTLSVQDLAMEMSRPERVCGIHFFNPAPTMSIVEVVRPLSASDATMDAVIDQAGFVVNALLFPY
jgi:3-hydroxybutyryl-CoA dehydrogenase